VLNNIDSRASNVATINNTIVSPAALALASYSSQTAAVEERVLQARNSANNITSQVLDTQNRINLLIARLQTTATPLDAARISQLQVAVTQTIADYVQLRLGPIVAGLQASVANQKTWIANVKNRQLDLTQQVTRLIVLKEQLGN